MRLYEANTDLTLLRLTRSQKAFCFSFSLFHLFYLISGQVPNKNIMGGNVSSDHCSRSFRMRGVGNWA